MPAPDPLARELLERERAEHADARAARLAYGRWITQLRVWAALDRERITEPGEQARFIANSLWPDLRPEIAEAFAEAVRANTSEGRPLRRPGQPRDVVGDELARLLVEHGYIAAGTAGDAAPEAAEPGVEPGQLSGR